MWDGWRLKMVGSKIWPKQQCENFLTPSTMSSFQQTEKSPCIDQSPRRHVNFSFAEHSITVLYAKPVKLIKEHINFLYFTTSFNMIPTMVLKQVPDKFCMSEVFPELKNLKLLKSISQLSSFIHLCKHQISLASVGQILFGLEKKSLMVKSGLPTCQNLSKYKIFFSVKLFLATYLLTRPKIILTNIKNCLA